MKKAQKTDRTLEELRDYLLTEEGHFLRVQENICQNLSYFFVYAGYQNDGFENKLSDTKTGRWEWVSEKYGISVEFSEPKYRDAISIRHTPVEVQGSRKTEDALLLNTSNKSSAKVTRQISKEVKLATNAKVLESNKFGFDIMLGAEAGIAGNAANAGTQVLFKTESHLIGEFLRSWESVNGSEVTRVIADTLDLEPMSQYRISATIDKIKMNQTIETTGIIDFKIKITTPPYAREGDKGWNGNLNKFREKVVIEANSIKDLARNFLGISGKIYKSKEVLEKMYSEKEDSRDAARSIINALLMEDARRITTETIVEYNDAGDANLTVEKAGTWHKEEGNWELKDA